MSVESDSANAGSSSTMKTTGSTDIETVLLMALGGNGVKSRRTNERFVASSFSMMPKRQVQSGEVVEIDDRKAGENVQRISRLARRFESRRRSWRRVGRQRRRRTT